MAYKHVLELVVGEILDLDSAVLGSRNNGGISCREAEMNIVDLVRMSINIGLNGVLALIESVPELDGSIPRGRHN